MVVTGKPSSGKSVLSDWVVERLQAARGRRSTEVLTYTVGKVANCFVLEHF